MYSFYMAIMKIKGVVKEYAWGNKDFLPSLLGYEVSDKPQAEYWMGTHPSGEAVTEGKNLSERREPRHHPFSDSIQGGCCHSERAYFG